MPALNKFNSFPLESWKGSHNLSTAVIKAALSNTAPLATNTVLADIVQIAATGGYVAGVGGGYALDTVALTSAEGVAKLTSADEIITATGGDVGPFRYIVLYNDSSVDDKLIGWYDYGSSITLLNGATFTIDFDGTAGIVTFS